MGRFSSFVHLVNSVMRTLLALVAVGLLSIAGWFGYSAYHANDLMLRQKELELEERAARIDQLLAEVGEKQQQIDRLDTALRLSRVDHRLATLTVLDQRTDPETNTITTEVRFQEINDTGDPIDEPRHFTLLGDIVYVDYWVVKFADEYVDQADLERGTSICLFRRIFGELQNPRDGFVIDTANSRPNAYARGSVMSDFEKGIWDDFWNIANDPEKAAAIGIRAAHGEAPSIQARPGKSYRLHLRASGGLTITPEDASGR